jgi:N-dimethylarginine dimethylaminohydrolase
MRQQIEPFDRPTTSGICRDLRRRPTKRDIDRGECYSPTASFADVGIRNLGCPAFLMNLPLSLSTDEPNNRLMREMSAADRQVDRRKAISQFMRLYRFLSRRAVIYLLPSTPHLQDQPYVANVGAVLPHLPEETVVVSRFRSLPRVGESDVALAFFRLLNFHVHRPPAFCARKRPLYFEGEADLKHVRGNLYIGAHGLRTSKNALQWLASSFGMRIIEYPVVDEYLYHLDCCLLLLDPETIVLCRRHTDRCALRAIEKECHVEDVTRENVRSGITNSIVVGRHLLCDSPISELAKTHSYYPSEKAKIAKLEKLCARHGLEPTIFNLSEFLKSGAALSCLIMRLNHQKPEHDN